MVSDIRLVNRENLLERIEWAAARDADLVALRNWLEDYLWGEVDYEFESEVVEEMFTMLHVQLMDDEILTDPLRSVKLKRVLRFLRAGHWTYEHLILAMDLEKLELLKSKHHSGKISGGVLLAQVKRLSSYDFDAVEVLRMFNTKVIDSV